MEGVTVVEHEKVDGFLVETEFGAMNGRIDREKSVKLGKRLGANLIVKATITDIHRDVRSFQGYGIDSQAIEVECQIRVSVLDVTTGSSRFSKIIKGVKASTLSSSGKTISTNAGFAAVEAALKKLADDAQFKAALFGKKAAEVDGFVEVEFAPEPDNCDIEIDGKYVGGSPLKRRLPAGKEVKVRIVKEGFKEWNGVISPEDGLKITRELGRNR